MNTIRRREIEPLITREIQPKRAHNWVFGVSFVKKDGSNRTMGCRFGVTKYLKGGECAWSRKDHPNLMVVFDMNKKAYRSINLDTIYRVSIDDIVYTVVD